MANNINPFIIIGRVDPEYFCDRVNIKRHNLSSASSIQSAAKKLLEKDIITEINKKISVTDKLFSIWMSNIWTYDCVLKVRIYNSVKKITLVFHGSYVKELEKYKGILAL